MINVTVIGFGSVGSALSLLLLNNKHGIRLNVIEPSPSKEGAILDLLHGMTLYPNQELHVNDYDMFNNADFIYYSAGTPNIHGGSRLSTAKKNIELTREIFEGRKFNKVPYVIVITNPVDIVSYYVMTFSNLPSSHVIGTGTMLDSVRLSYYLAALSEYHVDEINAWVLGEHGESQVAVYSMSKIKEDIIDEMNEFGPDLLKEAENLTKNAAYQIRETQKGTIYGISKCAETILNSLLDSEVKQYPLSVLTSEYYNTLLNLDHSIYISVPVEISNKGIKLLNDLNLKSEELEAFQESAKIIAGVAKY